MTSGVRAWRQGSSLPAVYLELARDACHAGTCRQQQLNHLHVAPVARKVQRSAAVLGVGVGRRPGRRR